MIFSRENVSDKLAKILPHLVKSFDLSANQVLFDDDSTIAQKYIDKTFDLL